MIVEKWRKLILAYRFDDEFLNTLRMKCDIEAVVSRYVPLKRSGSSLVGLCPFHGEKTPSFHVNTAKQFFHCFGCNAGGDVITFIMKIENLSYIDAVVFLAEQVGMKVPALDTFDNEITTLRKTVLEMNKVAARFFYEKLNSPEGKHAMDYFLGRGLLPRTIVRFGLGYAPDKWDELLEHLLKKGFKKEDIKASGLVSIGKEKLFDRFRNRVMFPIIDQRNNIIGFGGRTMGNDPAKYLNTAETIAFKKGNNLYALNWAKSSKDRRLIICEGYMDVISLHQAGFTNAVATLGTALTPVQARLMRQYCDEVIICYDSDAAGKKAAKRGMDILNDADLKVRIVTIVGGKDPDDFIRDKGKKAFERLLDESQNRIDYRIDEIKLKYDITEPNGRAECLKEITVVLAGINNKIEQEIYISKVSNDFNISSESIIAEINVYKRKIAKYKHDQEQRKEMEMLRGLNDKINPQKRQNLRGSKLEEDIITILLNFPEYLSFIEENLGAEDFITDFNRKIFLLLCEKIRDNPTSEPLLSLSQDLNEDEMGILTAFIKDNQAFFMADKEKIRSIISELKEEKAKLVRKAINDSSDELFDASIKILKEKKKKQGN